MPVGSIRRRPTRERAVATVSLGLVGLAGSGLVAVLADRRRRLAEDAARLRVLADLAAVAQSGHPREQVAQAVTELAVPRVADLCLIEVVGADGRLQRLGGAVRGDQTLLAALMGRRPLASATSPTRVLPAATRHFATLDGDARLALAGDETDARLLGQMDLASAVMVPLVSRGRPFGRVILAARGPVGLAGRLLARAGRAPVLVAADDAEFAQTLAGRVALALENAALSAELSSAERQLEVILESVDVAITVRDIHGQMVYANQAAARLLRLPDVEAVKSFPPGELMARFDVYNEAGDPITLVDLPASRAAAGVGPAAPEPVIVRNVVKATGEERWLMTKSSAVTGTDGRVLLVVSLIQDVTENKRDEIAQHLLTTAARQLGSDGELAAAFHAVVEAAVPGLADWAGLDVVDSGQIVTVAVAHRDPEKVRLGWRLRHEWPVDPADEEGLPQVIRSGQPQLLTEVTDEMLVLGAQDAGHLEVLRAVGFNSIMIAPVRAGEHILGALSFVSSTSRRFDERDLELACDLGRQVGVMIANAQLHAEQAHIARTLQAGLIPEALPQLDGWAVSSAYRAAGRANQVGGDFYDIVRCGGGWAAIIGDVLGKGAAAASLTALARHTLAAIIESTADVAHAFEVLNHRLRERGEDFRSLCTIAVVELGAGPTATVYSAGHPLPLLATLDGAREVGRAGPMLGYLDEVDVAGTPVEVHPGERIVLYTDGVLDAVGSSGRFGEIGLHDAVSRAGEEPDDGAAGAIMAAIDGFVAAEQSDDIAIVSLTRSPVPAASLS